MSFTEDILPSLIWVSAIFLREPDKEAVHNVIQFLISCDEELDKKSPPLVFLSNFEKLSVMQKNKILKYFYNKDMLSFIRKNIVRSTSSFEKLSIIFSF